MNLKDAKIGDKVIIKCINLEQSVKRRFEVLGMTVGSTVSIINRKKSGTMIINIRGTRFAVGKDFAGGIDCELKKDKWIKKNDSYSSQAHLNSNKTVVINGGKI